MTEIEVRRHLLRAGILGVVATALLVGYQLLADSLRLPPIHPAFVALVVFMCPPSLLSIGFIDTDPGTGGFYIVWSLIAIFNAACYVFVDLALLRLRKSRDQS